MTDQALVPIPRVLPMAPRSLDSGLVELWLSGRPEQSLRTYRFSLSHFAGWVGADSLAQAATMLLSNGRGQANATTMAYRAHLLDAGFAPTTVNGRLYALRSVAKMARLAGLIEWAIEVPGVKVKRIRDTRGPGARALAGMLGASLGDTPRLIRDHAILRLLASLGLRAGEVVSLDLDNYEPARGLLWVRPKGGLERDWHTLPPHTKQALDRWIESRGRVAGPLFTNLDRAGKEGAAGDRRLSKRAIEQLVARYGDKAGVGHVWPHAMRHTAISTVLENTKDIGVAQKFGRHANIATTGAYLDAQGDVKGRAAAALEATLEALMPRPVLADADGAPSPAPGFEEPVADDDRT